MPLKQKTVMVCVFSLLFSSCATIQESVKNDDVLLKKYTVKENAGYQYAVSYRFKDSAKFDDVTLEVSVKKYQMCETEDRGVYDRTEITERKAIYKGGLSDLAGCYSDSAIFCLAFGAGLLLLPVCITDSFRAMDSSRHIGEVTETINSYGPNRCGEVSPVGAPVALTLNNGKGFARSADASGNVIFSISELGKSAKDFANPWGNLEAEGGTQDIVVSDTVMYHWIDRDYEAAMKQSTTDAYQDFLDKYPQSEYTDVITSRLIKDALEQAEKAVQEKDWEDAYSYWEIVKDNAEGLTNGEKKEFHKIEKFLRSNIVSKNEAYEFFPPEQLNYTALLTDPWSLKGKYIEIEGLVFQRFGGGQYLIRLGGEYVIYVTYFPGGGNQFKREAEGGFPTGAPVKILAEVMGTRTYATLMGGTNTVPWLWVIWMEALR